MRLGSLNPHGAVTALRTLGRDYWLFWSGETVSDFGSSLTGFALPLLTYRLTGSAINLALTMAAWYLPSLLFGLLAGALADRSNRLRLMIGVDIGRAVVIAVLPLMAWFDSLSVWIVYAVAFTSSTLGLLFGAAHFAVTPTLVPSEELVRANGYLHSGGSAASILGPPIGGALLAVIPIQSLILLDAASFLASACSIYAIRARARQAVPRPIERQNLFGEIRLGVDYVRQHAVLPSMLGLMFVVNVFGSAVSSELVYFVKRTLSASDSALGLVYSAAGIGAVAMGLLSPFARRRLSLRTLTLGPLIVHGVLIVAFAAAPNAAFAAVLWGALMAQITLFNIVYTSVWQRLVPDELLGRVSSVVLLVAFAGMPIGAIASGLIINRTGDPVPVFAIAGAAIAIGAAAFVFSPIRTIDERLAAPSGMASRTPR